jgi:hypothetical protein
MNELIQVGSTMWLDPDSIAGVRWIEESKPVVNEATGDKLFDGYPGYAQIIYRENTMFGPNIIYLSSDWPINRIRRALGLVSADEPGRCCDD